MLFDKTIQLLIFNGNPNGRIKCELSNWDGRVYKISRTELNEYSQRSDANYTGVYFLFGKDSDNSDLVYIGEAEQIYKRLKQHITDNCLPDWTECIVVLNKDNNLNKAHVKFLENRFYELAKNTGRFVIKNTTVPTRSSVSEYDTAMLEEFISNTKLLVNTLGYKVFEIFEIDSSLSQSMDDNNLFYIKTKRGADATGKPVADGFLVLKGSKIASKTVESFGKYLMKSREFLLENGIIDQSFVFTKNHIFTSPSLAAAIVLGRNANGHSEWKTAGHKTIREIQAENAIE